MATRKRPTKKQASRPVTGPQSKPHARRSQSPTATNGSPARPRIPLVPNAKPTLFFCSATRPTNKRRPPRESAPVPNGSLSGVRKTPARPSFLHPARSPVPRVRHRNYTGKTPLGDCNPLGPTPGQTTTPARHLPGLSVRPVCPQTPTARRSASRTVFKKRTAGKWSPPRRRPPRPKHPTKSFFAISAHRTAPVSGLP